MVGATTCLGLPDIQFVLMDEAAISAGHRPGDLPRPRDLEVTFTPAFTDIVYELRAHIVRARQ